MGGMKRGRENGGGWEGEREGIRDGGSEVGFLGEREGGREGLREEGGRQRDGRRKSRRVGGRD